MRRATGESSRDPALVRWLKRSDGTVARRLRRFALSAVGTYAAYWTYGLRHPALLRAPVDERPFPGDDLVPDARRPKTFSIEIAAARSVVWPFIVQLGYGRAGWYTWYPFDNGGVASAAGVVPALQRLAVGDYLPDGPRAAEGFGQWRVQTLDPERALVLFSRRNLFSGRELSAEAPVESPTMACSWAFLLEDEGPGRCRLLVRVRAEVAGGGLARHLGGLVAPFFDVGDTVMNWTMVQGIRERAERAHNCATAAPGTTAAEGSARSPTFPPGNGRRASC